MKALTISIILILSMLLIIFCAVSFIGEYTSSFNEALNEARTLYNSGDKDGAAMCLETLTADLYDKSKILCMVINHDEVNESEMAIKRLMVFVRSSDSDLFNAECSALISRIDNIYYNEKLNFANVF